MIAGQNIRFLPGAHIMSGGYLHAYITSNNMFCNSLLSQMPRDDICRLNSNHELLFIVYPNPGSGQFTIELSEQLLGKDIRMEVYASNGRLVATKSFESMGLHQVCLSGQEKGMYFISLRSGNKWAVERLILW